MKTTNSFLLLAVLVGLSQSVARAVTVSEAASKDSDFPASNPTAVQGKSGDLTVGGPADIYSAVAFAQDSPSGSVVTGFEIVFDIEETIPTGITTSLNVWGLGGPWDETSSRDSISGYPHIPEGSVTVTSELLDNGDDGITFSGANLTTLYLSGAVTNGLFWQDNDLASSFPRGATAFSRETPFGEMGFVTYDAVPEPATWTLIAVGLFCMAFLRRRSAHLRHVGHRLRSINFAVQH